MLLDKEKKALFLFIIVLIFIVFFIVTYFILRMNPWKIFGTDAQEDGREKQVLDKNIKEEEIEICKNNSDCIVVPYRHCCGLTKRAINKKYKKLYESTPEWQVFYGPICNVIGRCASDAHINAALCRSYVCVLKD